MIQESPARPYRPHRPTGLTGPVGPSPFSLVSPISVSDPASTNGSISPVSAAVRLISPSRPVSPSDTRARRAVRRERRGAAQREHRDRGVVDIRVAVVVEFERPAPWREPGAAHLPVAWPWHFLIEHPEGRAHKRGIVRTRARVRQRDHREHRVPDRGLARLKAPDRSFRCLFRDDEALKAGQGAPHDGMAGPVAEQMQCNQRVHPRWLDAPPAAVRLLPRDDPFSAAAQCGAARRPRRVEPAGHRTAA